MNISLKKFKGGNAIRRLAFAKEVLVNNLMKRHVPLIVILSLTNKCNLKCQYCYGTYFSRNRDDYPYEDLVKLFDEIESMGNKQVQLVGGEPLMHKDIGRIIENLKSRNTYTTMVTNAYFIPKKIDHIKNLDMLCISLDGPEEVNDSLRGKGSFKRALEGIEIAKSNDIPVRTYTLLTKKNYRSIDQLMEQAKEMNTGMIFELPHVPFHDISELFMSDSDIKNVLNSLIEYKKKGYPIFGSLTTFEYAANWPLSYSTVHLDSAPDFNYIPCSMGKFYAHIDTDGKVFPCAAKLGQKMDVLNCREVGFERAWKHLLNKPCHTCYHLSLTEYNQFFSMNRHTWLNLIKSNLREFGLLPNPASRNQTRFKA